MPSDSTRNTLVRQWEMLKIIPSHGAGVTAKELTGRLNEEGFTVTKRQVERDLRQLQESFPLDCNDKSIPYGWRWIEGASFDLPGITLAESVSLHLIEEAIRPLLPKSVLKVIEPRLRQADSKLRSQSKNSKLARWTDKVRTLSPTIPLQPPEINQQVLEDTQAALLNEHKLDVSYISMGTNEEIKLTLNPLALVQRGVVTYLMATANSYKDVRIYAIHRITSSAHIYEKSSTPSGFDLDKQIDSGFMHFGNGESIKFMAVINEWLKRILEETPLSEDQTIIADGDYFTVKATVLDSWQLQWWILSQGNGIEVIQPASLRKNIKDKLTEALEQY